MAWNDDLLMKYKEANAKNEIVIPDFGSSEEIFNALLKIDLKHWNKLNSNDNKYIILRKELFSDGNNLNRAKEKRFNN